jgi:DNA-binding CsgD family transcriptional regulator
MSSGIVQGRKQSVRPTLAAEELKRNLAQYLTTTFALADRPARDGLERFLNDPAQGMFRGPYLRIRTPYLHQVQAWQRLNSKNHVPEPTLITTGTGSGKTEAFLIPVLDHCRRERAAGKPGVKAVLLYPMNAPALDQLTSRERQVLIHVAEGLSNSEIAAAMFLSEATVKSHLGRVLAKLHLRDRVQAVIFAYQAGLVHPQRPGRP